MPENLPVATGAEQLLRVSPQPVATAAVDIAPPEGVQAQQQPRAVPAAVEAQVAMQQARGAPDSVVPRVLDTATMQQALSRDTGEQRRENPSDTAEKLPLSFIASRSAVDNDAAPPRGFETSRDDAMQNFRTLQQLNQQVQQPQQAPSPAMPAITPGSTIAATPAPAPLTPAAETLVSVNTPVTDASWGEQIGQRVVLIANRHLQNAEIRLSPAELGPLRVQVRVDDGAANITFHATHAVTRDAIEQAMPRLREMFLENGLNLGEANVSEQGVGPQADTGHEAPGQAQADSAGEGDRLNAEALESAPETRSRRVIDGLVDTFV
jgi:flagellar hook-length control protein FliK